MKQTKKINNLLKLSIVTVAFIFSYNLCLASASSCTFEGDTCTMDNGSLGVCKISGNTTVVGGAGFSCVASNSGGGTPGGGTSGGGTSGGGTPSGGTTGSTTNVSSELAQIQSKFGLSGATIKQILTNLLSWMLAIIGIIGIIGFIIAGVQYLLSAGDDDMIETAKRNMKWAIVGVVVALGGFVIIQAINTLLQGSSWNF